MSTTHTREAVIAALRNTGNWLLGILPLPQAPQTLSPQVMLAAADMLEAQQGASEPVALNSSDAYYAVEQRIVGRYRVEKRNGGGFWPYCVKAGDGGMELFVGHKSKCEEVAQALQTACLDGAFMASEATHPAPAAEPAAVTDERAAFEAWVNRERPSLWRVVTTYNEHADVHVLTAAWEAWQAHAALATRTPEPQQQAVERQPGSPQFDGAAAWNAQPQQQAELSDAEIKKLGREMPFKLDFARAVIAADRKLRDGGGA